MSAQELRTEQGLALKREQVAKMIGAMRLSQLFSLPEDDFKKLIEDVEDDALFKKLMHEWRVIAYRRFPDTDICTQAIQIKEEITPSRDSFSVGALLDQYPEAIGVLKRIGAVIGPEEFNRFLWDIGVSAEEIVDRCDLTNEEAKVFMDFMDKFEVSKSAFSPSIYTTPGTQGLRNFRIAQIEKRGNNFVICPTAGEDYLIKGKYSINISKFEELIDEGRISPIEVKNIRRLFSRLDVINRRASTIYQVIYHIKELQRDYLESGNLGDLKPFAQKELADRLGLNPSTISRSIADKSIVTPRGFEKPLKFFFSDRKREIQALIRDIVAEERGEMKSGIISLPYSDQKIREELREKYGIDIARRTVNQYRKGLRIPSARQRRMGYR